MSAIEKFENLFDEMVPFEGKAPTVAGEIVRAAARLVKRWNNDGDKVGVGYGNYTCNCAARYLERRGNKETREVIRKIWGGASDEVYDGLMEALVSAVVGDIEEHPQLKVKESFTDMLSCATERDLEYECDYE